MPSLKWDEAMRLLVENKTPQNVIEHCSTVSVLAHKIAKRIKAKGHRIDIDFVRTAALLHDIGRSKTHDIKHGIEGAKILKDYPEYARVCECHIGAGILKDEAAMLGLPPKDYIPLTLEEKVVCFADKLIEGNREVMLEETIKRFQERLGREHPTIQRMIELEREITSLMD
jgi:uncharacterized protein